jgi:hypothetical protein
VLKAGVTVTEGSQRLLLTPAQHIEHNHDWREGIPSSARNAATR